jgi:hypothetical protein
MIDLKSVNYFFSFNKNEESLLEKTIDVYSPSFSVKYICNIVSNFCKGCVSQSDWQLSEKILKDSSVKRISEIQDKANFHDDKINQRASKISKYILKNIFNNKNNNSQESCNLSNLMMRAALNSGIDLNEKSPNELVEEEIATANNIGKMIIERLQNYRSKLLVIYANDLNNKINKLIRSYGKTPSHTQNLPDRTITELEYRLNIINEKNENIKNRILNHESARELIDYITNIRNDMSKLARITWIAG